MTITIENKDLEQSKLDELAVRTELALLLFQKGGFSADKASDIAGLDKMAFERAANQRRIELTYSIEQLRNHPIPQAVKKAVQEKFPNTEIILFGSRARGDFSKHSDWDFLVLFDGELTVGIKNEIRRAIYFVELYQFVEEVIASIIRSKEEWETMKITGLYKNVQNDGIKI